jgi:hypothetical protein
LNNLLGEEKFTKDSISKLCKKLPETKNNSYTSIFGGDFDVSLLILALQS